MKILLMILAMVVVCCGKKNTVFPGTVLETFFNGRNAEKGYIYAFGGRTSFKLIQDKRNSSIVSLKFDDREVSAGIGFGIDSGEVFDFSSHIKRSVVRFRVKGVTGSEWFKVGIVDNGKLGADRVTVNCRSRDWFALSREWQTVAVPFSAFLRNGIRWYDKRHVAEAASINWTTISGITFSTGKEDNLGCSGEERLATVFIDNVEIVDMAAVDMPIPRFDAWGLRKCSGELPAGIVADSTRFFSWLSDSIAPFTSVYTYGAPTDYRLCRSGLKSAVPVLNAWFNDNEWSGITLYRSDIDAIDLSSVRRNGSLVFKVRGAQGGRFNIGILDDASDGADRNVQTTVRSVFYVTPDSTWQEVVIPLADFEDYGKWWHSDAHYEVNGKVDWSKITQIRFSTDKNANTHETRNGIDPLLLEFADIRFLSSCTAFSSAQYWHTFSSEARNKVVDDFNSGRIDRSWICNSDSLSTMTLGSKENGRDHTPALAVTHSLNEWGSALREFHDCDTVLTDWSNHAAVQLDAASGGRRQVCGIMVIDSGGEAWYAPFSAGKKWKTLVVPFSRFKPFDWWQPEGAVRDNRMDLEQIRQYMLRPELKGNNAVIMVDNVTLTNNIPSERETEGSLFVSQVGYETTMSKRFLCRATSSQPFALFNDQKEMVFSGVASEGSYFSLAGAEYRSGYFTEVHETGTYSLVLQKSGEQKQVSIQQDIYRQPLTTSLKAFYFQRSGCALEPEFAGKWARPCGHTDTSCVFHPSTGKEGVGNVQGGWYDAGDYGKYVVPAGITVATMLSLHELYPEAVGDNVGIPESGNGVSDLLDEARYEIEWMRRMQDSDGGVYFKVGTLTWDGFTMPEATTADRYIIGKSTASTLEFSAVFAMAARLYRSVDRHFASDCLNRAAAAWKWAVANPSVREPKETGGTGAYGDGRYDDEFFHAASELYCTTRKGTYRKFIERNASFNQVKGPAGWNDVGNLGVFSLCRYGAKFKGIEMLRSSLVTQADRSAEAIERHPCRIPSEQFIWGSNSYMLNHAVVLCYAHMLSGKRRYLERAQDIVDYIFGVNPIGYSFVTGFGTRAPLHPHHRIMGADTVEEPIPGFLVGGPNGGREDEMSNTPGVYYPHKEPALAYVDLQAAFACNEVAINWNAPLVFVLGYLQEAIKN